MEALVMGILLDMIFFARFLYIKTKFYKTKGVAVSFRIYYNKGNQRTLKNP